MENSDRHLSDLVHQWEEQRPDLDPTPFRLVAVTMQLAQLLESEFRALAQAQYGIGSGDLRILMALRRSGPPYSLRPTDLFKSLLIGSGTVTKQVDRLAEAGYVKKVLPKGANLRRVITLTPKGVRAADHAQEAIATSLCGIAPTLAALPHGDVQTMLRSLEQVHAAALACQAPANDNGEAESDQ
jgi:DNA-binding MarR family transcriptional regulator